MIQAFAYLFTFLLFVQTPEQQLIGSWRLIDKDAPADDDVKILIFRPDHTMEMIENGKKQESGFWRVTPGQGQNLLSLSNKIKRDDKDFEEIFLTYQLVGNQLILSMEGEEFLLLVKMN